MNEGNILISDVVVIKIVGTRNFSFRENDNLILNGPPPTTMVYHHILYTIYTNNISFASVKIRHKNRTIAVDGLLIDDINKTSLSLYSTNKIFFSFSNMFIVLVKII